MTPKSETASPCTFFLLFLVYFVVTTVASNRRGSVDKVNGKHDGDRDQRQTKALAETQIVNTRQEGCSFSVIEPMEVQSVAQW